jgi:hypothetical protein
MVFLNVTCRATAPCEPQSYGVAVPGAHPGPPHCAYDASAVGSYLSERGPALQSQRIDYFEKREAMEIHVVRTDLLDAMLAHENCRVRIVEDISGQMRRLRNHLGGNVRMALCRHEHAETRRNK